MDYQSLVFNWISLQGPATSLVVVALGALFSLHGFRFGRMLVALIGTLLGFFFGLLAGETLGLPVLALGLAIGGSLGLLSLARYRIGLALGSVATFGTLGYYLAYQLGMPAQVVPWFGLLGAAGGLSGMWLYTRALPVVLTALHGAALLVIGGVGLASSVLPSMAATFVTWSASIGVLVPFMMTMLVVTGYAYQVNAAQGDMETGVGRTWNQVQV